MGEGVAGVANKMTTRVADVAFDGIC
jgi:hypothetical protein